jgi:DNA-binding IclR family transcriptional regulator
MDQPPDDILTQDDRDPLFVRSVEKAFRILQAFDGANPSLSLRDIAVITGLDKSGTQRFTHTLVQLGMLRKEAETKRFVLSPGTLELGSYYIYSNPLIRAATPHLFNLSQATGEAISLTVPDGTGVIYIYRLLSRNILTTDVVAGTRLPAYCTAPGIAVLATLPPDEATDILERSDRRALTPQTKWQMPDLKEKLRVTAERGFAIACEEIYQNDISIAAAILDGNGRGIAAVTLAVSKLHMTPEAAIEKFSPQVIGIAQTLSQPRTLRTR